jgi:hypothetical protein
MAKMGTTIELIGVEMDIAAKMGTGVAYDYDGYDSDSDWLLMNGCV